MNPLFRILSDFVLDVDLKMYLCSHVFYKEGKKINRSGRLIGLNNYQANGLRMK